MAIKHIKTSKLRGLLPSRFACHLPPGGRLFCYSHYNTNRQRKQVFRRFFAPSYFSAKNTERRYQSFLRATQDSEPPQCKHCKQLHKVIRVRLSSGNCHAASQSTEHKKESTQKCQLLFTRHAGFEPATYRFVGIETGAKRVILCTNLSNVPKKLVEF